jgi:hypothetical protein
MDVPTQRVLSSREAQRPRRTLRSIGAVFTGLLVIVILATAVDTALHATGIYPPYGERMADALFIPALAYRVAFGVVGGYLTARLAPDRPLQHALVLGAVGVFLGLIGAVVMWDAGPAWYNLAVIAIAVPCAWAGARLHTRSAAG